MGGNILHLEGESYEVQKLLWDAPVSGTIYGTLLNYKGELENLGDIVKEAPYNNPPKAPILYIKPINTITSFGMPIPIPEGELQLEMGAALAVVFGRTATRVSEAQALEYVEGYTIINDVTIPHESVYRPAVKYKARDGFCPVGPWIVEKKGINPDALTIKVFINNQLKQENSTVNLIRSVSRLISEVTEFMTFHKGDILLVGVPENPPLASAGDHVRIEIEGIGSLENTIVKETELTAGVKL
ncbi:fumarylacetoacetate hydrolase family protein [Bacillus sp. FJAT-49736]|nr:fumarylacetoacetate hydrolase family protein [Bacillus sp. FJAT-49736]MBS4171767.1 fumarylacetoacetate hydrolase family protein [Bacillus sp. FJAT-49736]